MISINLQSVLEPNCRISTRYGFSSSSFLQLLLVGTRCTLLKMNRRSVSVVGVAMVLLLLPEQVVMLWKVHAWIPLDQHNQHRQQQSPARIAAVTPTRWNSRRQHLWSLDSSSVSQPLPATNMASTYDMEIIRKQVDSWAQSSKGIMYRPTTGSWSTDGNSNNGPSFLYRSVFGETIVCDSSTVLGSVSQFWNDAVRTIIDRKDWEKTQFSEDKWRMIDPNVVFVQFIAFPNLSRSTTSTANTAMVASATNNDHHQQLLLLSSFESILNFDEDKQNTIHFKGTRFTVRLFYPQQEETTLVLSSPPPPYPVLALEFRPAQPYQQKKLSQQKKEISGTTSDLTKEQAISNALWAVFSSSSTDTNPPIKDNSLPYDYEMNEEEDDDESEYNDSIFSTIVNKPVYDLQKKKKLLRNLYNSHASADYAIFSNEEIMNQPTYVASLGNYKKQSNTNNLIMTEPPSSILRKYYEKYHLHHNNYDDFHMTTQEEMTCESTTGKEHAFENKLQNREFTMDEIEGMSAEWVFDQMEIAENDPNRNPLFCVMGRCFIDDFDDEDDDKDTNNDGVRSNTDNGNWFANLLRRRTISSKIVSFSRSISKLRSMNSFSYWNRHNKDLVVNNNDDNSDNDVQGPANIVAEKYSMEWIVSNHNDGDHVYGDVFVTIEELFTKIIKNAKEQQQKQQKQKQATNEKEKENHAIRSSTASDKWDAKPIDTVTTQPTFKSNSPSRTSRIYSALKNNIANPIRKKFQGIRINDNESFFNKKYDDSKLNFDILLSSSSSSESSSKLLSNTNNQINDNDIDTNELHQSIVKKPQVVDNDSLVVSFDGLTIGSSSSSKAVGQNKLKNSDFDNTNYDDDDGSVMLITPQFFPYNPEAYKRFAITIHSSLQRSLKLMYQQHDYEETDTKTKIDLPMIQFHLEVFHPEYIGSKQGYCHSIRRSPFPMIQICYHVSY